MSFGNDLVPVLGQDGQRQRAAQIGEDRGDPLALGGGEGSRPERGDLLLQLAEAPSHLNALEVDSSDTIAWERIVAPRSWNKLAVIAHEDDHAASVDHALLQARRQGDL